MPARALTALVAVALAVRLGVLFTGPWADPWRVFPHSPDSPRYVQLADTLRTHHTFGKPSEDGSMHAAVERLRRGNGTLPPPDASGFTSEGFRTPGYPLFLALLGGAWGLRLACLAQCLLGALAVGCVARIAFALGCPSRSALAVGWLCALHPGVVTADCLPLTESLFGTLALIGLATAAHGRTPAGQVVPGALVGFAALVRPLGLLYLPTAIILTRQSASRKRLATVAVVLAAVVPSVMWASRNRADGHGSRVSTVGELNLYFYGAAYVVSEERGDDWLASWPTRLDELERRLAGKLEPGEDVFAAARREALAEFRSRPVTTAKVFAKSELKLLLDHSAGPAAALYGVEYRPSGFFSDVLRGKFDAPQLSRWSLIALPWTALNALIAVLAVVGTVRAAVGRKWSLVFACLIPIVLFSLATFPVGLERFRLPFAPFLFVLAACAVWTDEERKVQSAKCKVED